MVISQSGTSIALPAVLGDIKDEGPPPLLIIDHRLEGEKVPGAGGSGNWSNTEIIG